MLGKILQTVGERMAFYYDGYAGYHTTACFDFPLCTSVRMQPFVCDDGWRDNNSGRAGDDMSHRACTGSEATKLCVLTWLVDASGPHTLFCVC